jgi:leucine dehydrogenase
MRHSTAVSVTDYEHVAFCRDDATGLRAIIAVHDTTLGPALGGLRMRPYATDDEALFDVLRLARGMTLKSAAAGLNFGGGKAVILGDSSTSKTRPLLQSFGRFVEELGGKYITAEDMGIGTRDIAIIREETPHVAGLADQSGDPSPFTALGTFVSIRAAWKHATGNDDLSGRKVLVQGVGNVGLNLVKHLIRAGAEVLACDLNSDALRAAVVAGARTIAADDVYSAKVDIYAPCAAGATLNPATIPQLRCRVVCGAANNQLLDEARDGQALHDRGILYAPDFVVNAGGIINISVEQSGAYDPALARRLTEEIGRTVASIFATSASDRILPQDAAIRLAESRLRAAREAVTAA